MAWHTPRKGGRDCPSPIVVGKFVIVSDMAGIPPATTPTTVTCYWKERLGRQVQRLADRRERLVYFVNEDGATFVIEPGETLEIVAENQLTVGRRRNLPRLADPVRRPTVHPLDEGAVLRREEVDQKSGTADERG